MARILFTYVLPLLLPTVLYFVWAAWARHKRRDEGAGAEDVDIKTPWLALAGAGVALMTAGLVASALLGPKNEPGSVYYPPHMDGDVIVPGRYGPPPETGSGK
ncbi:MAG: hypothetical protein HQL36_05335 [Alphaproteobacteria bacterium]|nr:hypothetical protein [Alphaproteobacteria bacterium]MBF0249916.1 hypothetical protein [Alphaproteobacteria bacterium]